MAKVVDCQCRAFQLASGVLSRPWSALILTAMQAGPRRFGELADTAAGLGTKVLSARLKDLESRGLIKRHVEPGPPVRVSYDLTEQGRAFGRVAEAIQRWGLALTQPKAHSPEGGDVSSPKPPGRPREGRDESPAKAPARPRESRDESSAKAPARPRRV